MQRERLTTSLLLELAYVAVGLLALIIVSIAGGLHAPALWTLATIVAAAFLIGRGASRGVWRGVSRTGAASDGATNDGASRGTAPRGAGQDGLSVDASEERLTVDKRARARERVRLRKYVVTEQVTVTVPVRREHVRLEREPIGDAEADAGVRELGEPVPDYSITLLEEEIVVDKRVVPRERVTLAKHVVTENEHISEAVRREEIEVRHDDIAD